METIKSKTGKTYTIERNGNGYDMKRTDTGSKVRVSDGMIKKTTKRLNEGEAIPFRTISYTVAIETGVVFILRDIIQINTSNKTYTKR